MKSILDGHVELSTLYKALAHPVRLAIVDKLLISETCGCNDLVVELHFAQATISEHLRKLKKAHLITVYEKGPRSVYSLNKDRLKQFVQLHQQQIELRLFSFISV